MIHRSPDMKNNVVNWPETGGIRHPDHHPGNRAGGVPPSRKDHLDGLGRPARACRTAPLAAAGREVSGRRAVDRVASPSPSAPCSGAAARITWCDASGGTSSDTPSKVDRISSRPAWCPGSPGSGSAADKQRSWACRCLTPWWPSLREHLQAGVGRGSYTIAQGARADDPPRRIGPNHVKWEYRPLPLRSAGRLQLRKEPR